MFVKGKVICTYVSVCMIYISWRRDPGRIRGDLWRCLEDYLVTSVRRHLQVGVAFSITNRSTVGSRSTVAKSVTSHLFKMSLWRGTPLFTPGRNHTGAHSATFRATMLPTSRCMSKSTPRINYTNVTNVNILKYNQATWRGTIRATLAKSQTDAQHASIRALQVLN